MEPIATLAERPGIEATHVQGAAKKYPLRFSGNIFPTTENF